MRPLRSGIRLGLNGGNTTTARNALNGGSGPNSRCGPSCPRNDNGSKIAYNIRFFGEQKRKTIACVCVCVLRVLCECYVCCLCCVWWVLCACACVLSMCGACVCVLCATGDEGVVLRVCIVCVCVPVLAR